MALVQIHVFYDYYGKILGLYIRKDLSHIYFLEYEITGHLTYYTEYL